MKSTIVFTGGHHNSALEVARAIKKEGFEVVWIGHKFTARGEKSLSAEYQEVTENKIKFFDLKTGKFYKKYDLFEWLKIVFGFIQAAVYLISVKPKLIFSSGGYISVPVVIVGKLFGIPSITHEQTVVAGWANKAIAPFVQKILLTHASSLKNYPKGKSQVVGLPLRSQLLDEKFKKDFNPPLLYITCGKQGSHIINQALFPIIPKLVEYFTVVHQTGASTLNKDVERARRLKEKLGGKKSRYIHSPYFFSEDVATYLRSADIVVSRAGAHASYELMVLNKKTVLIPIPWVSHNEQMLNAKLVARHTNSLVLSEDELDPETLFNSINKLRKSKKVRSSINLPIDATSKIVEIIHQYI